MKTCRPTALIIIAFCAVIPDLLVKLLAVLHRSYVLPYYCREYLELLNLVPWQGMVFGIVFSVGVSIALGPNLRIGANEIFAMFLLCPLVQFFVPLLAGSAGRLLSAMSIPLFIPVHFLQAALIAALTGGVLRAEIGLLGALCTGAVAACASSLSLIQGLPVYPIEFWHLVVGLTIGLFIIRD